MRISQRLKDIEYQVLKNLWFEPTDEQRVRMVKRIMYSALRQAATRGEDLSAFATDIARPQEILGVSLSFNTSIDAERIGRVFTIERGSTMIVDEDIDTARTSLGSAAIPSQTPPGPSFFFNSVSVQFTGLEDDLVAIIDGSEEVEPGRNGGGGTSIYYEYQWIINGSDVTEDGYLSTLAPNKYNIGDEVQVRATIVVDDNPEITLTSAIVFISHPGLVIG